jgi:branched-chain amino acid transport system ATP-binding protein
MAAPDPHSFEVPRPQFPRLQFGKMGIPILLVEQNAHLALALASRAYVMETGSITLSGSAADLRNNPDVLVSYLSGARENVNRRIQSDKGQSDPGGPNNHPDW